MGYKVDNAVIMAAGFSSRFAPISYERPKPLIKVKSEVLIERQIRQLRERGIDEIIIVVGYRKEDFYYLKEKYGVQILENVEYETRNNNSSIFAAKEYIQNTYICSADNYFTNNPFEREVDDSYYAALYSEGPTKEWCMELDEHDYITKVTIGGERQWYMLGHAFWNSDFSSKFLRILCERYDREETRQLLWESIYCDNIASLPMKARKYKADDIYEFDSLDELRLFDSWYINHSESKIMENIAKKLNCKQGSIKDITPTKDLNGLVTGMIFQCQDRKYKYDYTTEKLEEDET